MAETHPRGGPANPLQLREALDAAVRTLALSTGTLRERTLLAGAVVINAITAEDLPDPEDRKLLEGIHLALIELDLLDWPAYPETSSVGLTDEALTRLAAQVIDLRDAITGRALRQAAESPPHRL